MKKTKKTIFNRIVAVVLLVATLAGITTSVNKKVEAACNHSNYSQTIISQASCNHTGAAYCVCRTCGYTWTKTLPKTSHSPYVKVVSGYTQLRCAICETRFYFSSTPASLDDFARYIYGKQYRALSGTCYSGERQNVAINWISYALGCTKDNAKRLCKDYNTDLWLEAKNVYNLSYFINRCYDLGSRYGLQEAEALAGIASKAVFVAYSQCRGSNELEVLSRINPTYTRLTKNFKTVCRDAKNLRLGGNFETMKNRFSKCKSYGILFTAPRTSKEFPSETPTYLQLFNTTTGKTNLDRFCGFLVGDDSIGFKEICKNKTRYAIEYSYIMIWLVRPALKKLYANCFCDISSDPMVLFDETLSR